MMKKSTAQLLALIAPLCCLPALIAQNAPAAGGGSVAAFNQAPPPDQFNYSLYGSESVLVNYNGGNGTSSTTNIGGDAAYVSGSQYHPTSLVYSGGYMVSNTAGQANGVYQTIGVSQVINSRHFSIVLGDLLSYLPSAPVFGLSGVVGVGDVGTSPISFGDVPTQSILTNYGTRITNTASVGVTAKLTGSTNLNLSGAYTIQRFIDQGLDNDDIEAGATLSHRFDARNSAGVGYQFSEFKYKPYSPAFLSGDIALYTQGVNVQYEHSFTRRLSLEAAAGPQWTDSNYRQLFPRRTTIGATAALFYAARMSHYVLSYTRGSNAGSGVLLGTISDNANFTAQHDFSRNWEGSFSVNYAHASSLGKVSDDTADINSFYAGVQATRRFGEHWSAWASYNVIKQTYDGTVPSVATAVINPYTGTGHIISFGVRFAPTPVHFRKH